jgi:hypothetical protein
MQFAGIAPQVDKFYNSIEGIVDVSYQADGNDELIGDVRHSYLPLSPSHRTFKKSLGMFRDAEGFLVILVTILLLESR